MKPETKFRRKIDPLLKKIPNSWWESISQKSIIGTPDKLGCINGKFVALEFKATEKSPVGSIQELKLKRIIKAGGIGYLVYPENWDYIYKLLCKEGARNV